MYVGMHHVWMGHPINKPYNGSSLLHYSVPLSYYQEGPIIPGYRAYWRIWKNVYLAIMMTVEDGPAYVGS